MNIIIWNECYISGGADWSLIDLIISWPQKDDNFTIYINKSHEGFDLISSKTTGHAKIKSFLFVNEVTELIIGSRWIKRIPEMLKNPIRSIIKIITFLATPFIFWSLISKKECDILLLNNGGYPGGLSNYIISLIAKLKNVSKRFMIVRNFPDCGRKSFTVVNMISNYSLTKIITVSDSLRWEMLHKTTIRKELLIRIHNGISINNKLEEDKKNIISRKYKDNLFAAIIGTLEDRKGHEILFRAWVFIKEIFPESKLLVIGSSKSGDKIRLEKVAHNLNISESIVWIEYVSNIGKYYNYVDVVVMPSQNFESFGRVCAEAMAFKKPIVASNVGGIPEIIEHGEDGYLFKHDDPYELAKIIIELFSSIKLRDRIGKQGFKKYNNYFTAQIMAKEYADLMNV